MKRIGILGGGQLARMLALKSQKLGFETYILSPSSEEPAAQLISSPLKRMVSVLLRGSKIHHALGDPNKPEHLKRFISLVDILTFESEFISSDLIKKAAQDEDISIAPSLQNLKNIQDRLNQKQILEKHNLNTSPFIPVTLNENKNELKTAQEKLGSFVLKTRTGGYDGYGTFIFKTEEDFRKHKDLKGDFIAEKFIPFKRELAISAARNKKNEIVFTPLVESHQENARCLWVKGPSEHKDLENLKKQITNFMNAIQYEGLLAFELFDTEESLIINELAPRVHNSGHYSLNALSEDQFTLHLKAISNKSLKTPKVKQSFAMLNLLGEGIKKLQFKNQSLTTGKEKKYENFYLWWYGKKESRQGRKMGHINATGSTPEEALDKLLKSRKEFKV